MRLLPHDAWVIGRSLCNQPVNGHLAAVSEAFRPLAEMLEQTPPGDRQLGWNAYLIGRADRDEIVKAVADIDPMGPPPALAGNHPSRCATLASVRRLMANTPWPWPGWLAAAVLNSLAADPGVGKSTLAVYLACILWFRRPWPDGQANPFPEKTRMLWIPGDHHYAQLLDLAEKYGLPDEAILFNASEDNPTGGLDLDDKVERDALRDRIRTEAPGVVIVDTVGMTTGRNLCKPEDARDYFGPLMTMANDTGVAFLLLTHLSRDAQALGRRIVGASRVVWKLTEPDPEGQPDRRRLWVDKSHAIKPPAMGMSISESGCTFDLNPPAAPEPRRPGRPADPRDKAKQFIRESLANQNDQIGNALCARWEKDHEGNSKTFWRAIEDLKTDGDLTADGGPGTRKQTVLHLNGQNHPGP
jgi:hypothetical protein